VDLQVNQAFREYLENQEIVDQQASPESAVLQVKIILVQPMNIESIGL